MCCVADGHEAWNVATTCYARWNWNQVAPDIGSYDFSIIDTWAAKCIAKGKKIAFGIKPTVVKNLVATPEWLFTKAKAKFTTQPTDTDTTPCASRTPVNNLCARYPG